MLLITFLAFCISSSLSLSISGKLDQNLPSKTPTPVVLWHGMGDCCCNPFSLGRMMKFIQAQIPNVYILSIMMGSNVFEDIEYSFTMEVNEQVEIVCKQIAADPKLKYGYNAIGFSQGAQFLRAVAQRCRKPQMLNLISLGGQHQGVYGLPHCFYPPHKWCNELRELLNFGAYWNWVQNSLVQAEYWHDPLHEDKYREKSIFLADINNERVQNETYKHNLLGLENFVLVKFEYDTLVQPHETSWFGYYKPGQAEEIISLNQSQLYTEDRLGLKQLDESGRLHFLSVPGDHLQFTEKWFQEEIINRYLL